PARARSALRTSDSPRLSERSSRSERSEFRGGAGTASIAGHPREAGASAGTPAANGPGRWAHAAPPLGPHLCRHPAERPPMSALFTQFINLLGALLLLLAFAMISQRRILSLIHLFTLRGATLVVATTAVGYVAQQPHLYVSAALTFALKVVLIPVLLHRVIDRLDIRWDVETLINIPTTMLIGILLVI